MKRESIVFDLDGVLVDLHSSLEKSIHKEYPLYNISRVMTYDFNKSLDFAKVDKKFLDTDRFSSEKDTYFGLNAPRKLLLSKLSDIELFKNAEYFDGVVEGLVALSEYYDIIFHSFAYTNEIAQFKSSQLYTDFSDKFDFTVITSVGRVKPALANVDYIVEDNLFDLNEYIGCESTKLCLIDRPYNSELHNPELSSVFERSTRFKNINNCFKYFIDKAKEA